jgi:hypothetical protein
MLVIVVKLWHLGYMMMMLARDFIDLLKHTISTLVEEPTKSFDWHIFYGGLGIHV